MSSASIAAEPSPFARQTRGLTRIALRRFVRRPGGIAPLVVLVLLFGTGALASVLAPHGWDWIDLSRAAVDRAPSFAHPFGTDQIGRDIFDRAIYGIRTTEEVAFGAAALATFLGVVAGILAGFYGGGLDAVVMRVADIATAYPAVILTLAAIVYLGEAYPRDLILIFGGFMWASVARVVRAHVATLREREFVDAARALGASDARIITRHLVPNIAGTILVAGTSLVGQIVLIDATVEFFDYGLPASVAPSLGNLVSDVVQFKFGLAGTSWVVPGSTSWWIWLFPGILLVLILVCVNLVGDALDAAVNPATSR